MFPQKRTSLILFGIFLLAVIVRLPTLNRPLSKHHEFCTAVSLRIMQIWDKTSIATYNFNPAMTYSSDADKFINNYASGSGKMLDGEGNFYYVSHPPLAYYVPYFLFRSLGIKPDVLPIQAFNLLLHFISAIGVYLIIRYLTKEQSHPSTNLPALAGFVLYLFSPATLWFQSNTYMSDMAVQPLFIFGVLVALKFFNEGKRKHLLLLAVLIFLMTYTTWLGVFFALAISVIGIFQRTKKSVLLLFLLSISIATIAALAFTFFQYSQIAGWQAYYAEALSRFTQRVGWSIYSLLTVGKNYITGFLPLLVLLGLLLLRMNRTFFKRIALFFWIAAVPVLLLHFILQDYSGHDFTALYGALFLSVVAGMSFSFLQRRKIIAGLLLAYGLLSVVQYYYINRPGEISLGGERYTEMRDVGKSIARQSSGDEMIFLLNEKPSPEMIFYAGRNIQQIDDENEAVAFLQKSYAMKGVIFKKTDNRNAGIVKRISESPIPPPP